MIYLLDTNILSQEMAENPQAEAARFLANERAENGCVSVLTLSEVRSGIAWLRLKGHRRDHADRLEFWLMRTLPRRYGERVLPVTKDIADEAGQMFAAEKFAGRTAHWPDLLIAATAKVHGLTVVTLNRKHYELLGVPLVEF